MERKMGDAVMKSEEEQVDDERLLAVKLLRYRNPILEKFHDFDSFFPFPEFTSQELSKKSNKSEKPHESQNKMRKKQKINDSDFGHIRQWTVSYFILCILYTIYDIKEIYLFDEVCG